MREISDVEHGFCFDGLDDEELFDGFFCAVIFGEEFVRCFECVVNRNGDFVWFEFFKCDGTFQNVLFFGVFDFIGRNNKRDHFFVFRVVKPDLPQVFICFIKQNKCVGKEVVFVFRMPCFKARVPGELCKGCVKVHQQSKNAIV